MSKYSNEFKLKVVKCCIEENHGYMQTTNYFGIPSKTTVKQWVKKYQEYGNIGLSKNLKSTIAFIHK